MDSVVIDQAVRIGFAYVYASGWRMGLRAALAFGLNDEEITSVRKAYAIIRS